MQDSHLMSKALYKHLKDDARLYAALVREHVLRTWEHRKAEVCHDLSLGRDGRVDLGSLVKSFPVLSLVLVTYET